MVALLRAVNVGGATVAMADLRELLAGLGYGDVRTHLNSGNAVLDAEDPPGRVAEAVEQEIARRLGLAVPVTVRTGAELARIVEDDRMGDLATDPARRVVMFLPRAHDPAALARLQAADLGDEAVTAAGRELYAWCPGGLGRSPLMAALGKAFPDGTARNWRTVSRLAEMAA